MVNKTQHLDQCKAITQNRRVLKIGKSYYLNLPPEFVKKQGIEAEGFMAVICDQLLIALPLKMVKQ